MARLQSYDLRSDDKKLEALLKERIQLKVRLQGLEAEVAEVHAQKENLSQQAENAQSIQNRQLTESQAMLKSLEVRLQLKPSWIYFLRDRLFLSDSPDLMSRFACRQSASSCVCRWRRCRKSSS